MPTLYIIAGPPGIGKSTNGGDFTPNLIGDILNHDKLAHYYQQKGFQDFENYSNQKANEFIQQNLLAQKDFGIELNLGSEGHYDLIRYISKKPPSLSHSRHFILHG